MVTGFTMVNTQSLILFSLIWHIYSFVLSQCIFVLGNTGITWGVNYPCLGFPIFILFMLWTLGVLWIEIAVSKYLISKTIIKLLLNALFIEWKNLLGSVLMSASWIGDTSSTNPVELYLGSHTNNPLTSHAHVWQMVTVASLVACKSEIILWSHVQYGTINSLIVHPLIH